ncbi:MAG: alanine racemase [candidate division KSB1 bacterium]
MVDNAFASAPLRPAWIEIDLAQLRRNLEIIRSDMPPALRWCAVVKDDAYGHGAIAIAREALPAGASCLAVATMEEALALRRANIQAPILVFGERTQEELEYCLAHQLTCFVNDEAQAQRLNRLAQKHAQKISVHVEIDTGLSRHGVRWSKAAAHVSALVDYSNLRIAGLMTHFAMSDELDKTFAHEQLRRFQEVLHALQARGIQVPLRHTCNSGGYLDLPRAHFEMVRMGILPLGVYPSQVCRRIAGLAPIMRVKARIAALQHIAAGDHVGYGMRYTAESSRTIAVLPLGYGDGYPRVRNAGHVLIRGRRAPIVGGNAMDAMMVDVTEIPGVQQWEEVLVLGEQKEETISIHDLAKLSGTVSYDVMTKLSMRLPRKYVDGELE